MRVSAWLIAMGAWLGLAAQGLGRMPVRSYGPAQGVTPAWVFCLAQDHEGYLWAGTDEGLLRGDGERFTRIEGRLPHPSVHVLVADRRGWMWAGTPRGLVRWDGRTLHTLGAEEGLTTEGVFSMGEDGAGRIWAMQGGRPFVSRDGSRFEADPQWPEGATGLGLYAYPGEDLIAIRRDGACLRATPGGPWRALPSLPGAAHLSRFVQPPGWEPTQLAMDATGWIWVMGTYRLVALAPGASAWQEVRMPANAGLHLRLIRGDDGRVRGSAASGLFELHAGSAAPLPPTTTFIPEQGSRTCLVDREGGFWIGGYGIHRVLGQNRVRIYGLPEGLPSAGVWTQRRDAKGRLWIATSGGLSVATERGWTRVAPGRVNEVAIAPDGGVWCAGGELRGGLLRVDPTTLRAERIAFPGSKDARFSKGLVFQGNTLWAASFEAGLWSLERSGSTWHWRPWLQHDADHRSSGALAADSAGHVWFGYKKGAAAWDGQTWREVPGVLDGQVQGIAAARDGAVALVYLDSIKVTFHRFDGDAPRFERMDASLQVFPGLVAYAAAFDRDEGLWIGCNRGLVRLGRDRGLRSWWGSPEGMPSEDCSQDGIVLLDEDLWISTSAGLVRLREPEAKDRPLGMPLLAGAWVDTRHLEAAKALEPMAGSGTLELAFFHPDFEHRERLQWEAWLEGRDAGWRALPGPRAVLGGLSPGATALRIRARLEDGRAGPDLRLPLHVLPQWWQRPWVRVGFAILGFFLIWGLLELRGQTLERRNRRLGEEVRARTRDLAEANVQLMRISQAKSDFLASMSHELRTPLNAILLYGELIHQRAEELGDGELQEDISRVKGSGQHLLSVINGILDLSKIEAGKMEVRPEPVDPRLLVHEVSHAVGPLAVDRKNALHVGVPETPQLFHTDGTRLRQILINLVGNAAKFTEAGEIWLSAHPEGLGWRFEVRDTGPGMSEEQLSRLFRDYEQAAGEQTARRFGGTGLGLALSRRLATLLGGRLEAHSELGRGSTFTLWIPDCEPTASTV